MTTLWWLRTRRQQPAASGSIGGARVDRCDVSDTEPLLPRATWIMPPEPQRGAVYTAARFERSEERRAMPPQVHDVSHGWRSQREAAESALAAAVTDCTGKERRVAAKALDQLSKFDNFSARTQPAAALAYAMWLDVAFRRHEARSESVPRTVLGAPERR